MTKELTKQELIRVFSSYLPYDFQIQFKRNIYPRSTEIQTLDLRNFDLWLNPGKRNSFQIKPILWDLSMITREISHEGKTFIPIVELAKLFNTLSESTVTKYDDIIDHSEYGIQVSCYIDESRYSYFSIKGGDLIIHNEYRIIDKLLEWHFNVFSLDDSQYINKATLKTK